MFNRRQHYNGKGKTNKPKKPLGLKVQGPKGHSVQHTAGTLSAAAALEMLQADTETCCSALKEICLEI